MAKKKSKAAEEVTKALQELDDLLIDWVVRTPAVTEDERREIRRVVEQRGKLAETLNQLQLASYQAAAQELADSKKKLAEVVSRMKSTTADIKKVKDVLALASSAIAVGARLMGAA